MNTRHLFLTSGGLTKNMINSFFHIIGKCPAVFVGGGDSAVLCREMVRTGFDGVMKQAVNAGLVYVGISAGSMYAAGNLEDGLNIIPNPIIPHWNGDKLMALPIDSGEIQLADGQAVYIEGYNSYLVS